MSQAFWQRAVPVQDMTERDVSTAAGISTSPRTDGCEAGVASGGAAAGIGAIDFPSPESSRVDDLNDFSANCRDFETLEGIVTADMRHRMERNLRAGKAEEPGLADAAPPPRRRRPKADESEERESAGPLRIVSQGRTLIVATDVERGDAYAKLLGNRGLICSVVVRSKAPSPDPQEPRPGRPSFLRVDELSIAGTFGAFLAKAAVNGKERHLPGDGTAFDLVLDLQPAPSFAGDRLPAGYYAPGADPDALGEAVSEMPEMKGEFEKPRFTAFLRRLCLHGRSRSRDCRLCLDLCPFAAIQSEGGALSIDPYRCEGCGACAVICPTGAVRPMQQPPAEELLKIVRGSLERHAGAYASGPTVVISDRDDADRRDLPAAEEGERDIVLYRVDQIAGVGLETLLGALACGAGRVVVVCGPQNPPKIRSLLKSQMQMACAILRGLDMAEDTIRMISFPPEEDGPGARAPNRAAADARSAVPPLPAGAAPPGADKRTMVRLAVRRLQERSGADRTEIPLPEGSPFGAVAVSAGCTLCMACASACPAGALSAAGDAPRLLFRESLCHQCGLCREACPEKSIRLVPRILLNPDAAEAPAVLCRTEPTRCVECGLIFGSQAMVERMQEKLAGHWMYRSGRQMRRLRMCRVCRTRDTLLSHERMSGNEA
ncbi:MAG: ferredoxin [Syntrophaceae bacterium PtaU1.Bin231]|nr:MAG: ferredoxin [Syntrophaceae bacterium PtaU1.Bin231]